MIHAAHVRLDYGAESIIHDLCCTIPAEAVTVIMGPNGCGKSTLLKGLARQLPLRQGEVRLGGKSIEGFGSKAWARQLAYLPQTNRCPAGITVGQLAALGRFPYQSLLKRPSAEDAAITADALSQCHVTDMADQQVATLSGGQQQKAWLAMVVAQDTEVMLLDEPTSALDLGHQRDVAHIIRSFAKKGKTIVAVLHDWYLAAAIADHLLVLKDGRLITSGTPQEVITAELIQTLYGMPCRIINDPDNGTPIVLRSFTKD